MAVPKRHTTSSSVRQRRMHIFINPPNLATCRKCGKKVKPHIVCQYCGYYRDREVINVLGKLTKKEKKLREKEMATTEKDKKTEKPLSMEELSKK